MTDSKLILGEDATPFTVAELVVRECPSDDWLEDVIYFIRVYYDRVYKRYDDKEV